MHVYHRDQIRDPGAVLTFLARMLGLIVLVALALGWLASCSSKQCKVYYRYDGGTVRPYYKAVECPGDVTRVECDDDQPLPNERCSESPANPYGEFAPADYTSR